MERHDKQARIRAAREWLGQADASLDRADDVKGDLKLMIAKAELAGAEPCKTMRKLKLWLSRGAALAVAVLLVLLIENGAALKEETQTESMAAVDALQAGGEEAELEEVLSQGKDVSEEKLPAAAVPPAEVEPAAEALPAVSEREAAFREGTVEVGSPQGAASPHMTYHPPQVPAPDKQLLMQRAGEVLRH